MAQRAVEPGHDRDTAAGGHEAPARPVAPGGWRRAIVGLLIGALAGAAIAFVLPRDDLPRRRDPASTPPRAR